MEIINVIGSIAQVVVWAFTMLLWVRLIIDWITVFKRDFRPRGFAAVLVELVFSITDPPIRMFRRIFPPLRLGAVAIDLGWMLTMVSCWILMAILPPW